MHRSRLIIQESEHVSVEDFGPTVPSPINALDYPPDLDLDEFLRDPNLGEISADGQCNQDDLFASIGSYNTPSDFDVYVTQPTQTYDFATCNGAPLFPEILPALSTPSPKKKASRENSIPLSGSVGVGVTQSIPRQTHAIALLNDLEESFRPRYKSDYFAQNGKMRKPRYITDRKGNHYILLRVPIGVFGYIRIDWVTTPRKNGDVFSMPYKFQASNDKSDIPDRNPLIVPIEADASGLMKLYLVLIKAKQDELKTLQPLRLFAPLKEAFGVSTTSVSENWQPLTPKQLIQEYELEKSQLAFTFCSLSHDRQSWIYEWDTTVLSSVMTEYSPETNRQKTVACPNCSYSFPVSIAPNDEEMIPETPTIKRKKLQTPATKKQRSFNEIDLTEVD